jgi:hypothetical protein
MRNIILRGGGVNVFGKRVKECIVKYFPLLTVEPYRKDPKLLNLLQNTRPRNGHDCPPPLNTVPIYVVLNSNSTLCVKIWKIPKPPSYEIILYASNKGWVYDFKDGSSRAVTVQYSILFHKDSFIVTSFLCAFY